MADFDCQEAQNQQLERMDKMLARLQGLEKLNAAVVVLLGGKATASSSEKDDGTSADATPQIDSNIILEE